MSPRQSQRFLLTLGTHKRFIHRDGVEQWQVCVTTFLLSEDFTDVQYHRRTDRNAIYVMLTSSPRVSVALYRKVLFVSINECHHCHSAKRPHTNFEPTTSMGSASVWQVLLFCFVLSVCSDRVIEWTLSDQNYTSGDDHFISIHIDGRGQCSGVSMNPRY